MFRKLAFLSFSLIGLFASTVALASPESQAEQMIKTLDRDNSGTIEKSETNPRFRLRRFNKVDLNKDGKIDQEEAIQMYQNIGKARR